MTEITLYRPGDPAVETMTVAELRRELATAMKLSAAHLVHLAAIWQELERRGEDMSALRSGIATYLPLIARGELNAHLVVRYAGHATLLRQLATLPPVMQDQLVENDDVTVVDFVDGEFVESSIPLAKLETRRLKNVVTDHILTPAEQRNILIKRRPATHQNSIARKAQKSGMRNMSPPEGTKPRIVNLPMTDIEWNGFREFVATAGVSLGGFAREAILSAMRKK